MKHGPGNAELFSAAEFAAALAPFSSKRRVQTLLGTPDGKKLVSGNLCHAWLLKNAPAGIVEELEKRRRSHCCRSIAEWIADPRAPWQPEVSIGRASEKAINEATRLQAALAVALALPGETSISERERIAAPEYKRQFGRDLSARHLARLITRTMDRDAGLMAWTRLEIYLPENTRPKTVAPSLLASSVSFPVLEDAFATIEDRANSTLTEISYCWRVIVECLAEQIAEGNPAKKAKARLCDYVLKAAPFMAESKIAFRVNLNRKLNAAAEKGVAELIDKRGIKSGNRRKAPEWEENIKLMAQWTRTRGGRESQAWRELWTGRGSQGAQFSQAFRDYYPFNPRSQKSQVPRIVRDEISPMIEATNAIHLGQKAARVALPSIHRDSSDIAAGEFYTCDDVTVNHYWFEEHEFGAYEFNGTRFNVGRGQWLLMVDERTDNPLSFLLMPNRSYNSYVIRTLNTKTFSDERIGLPFKGMKYERGCWEAKNIASQFSWPQINEAFARHGFSLQIRTAKGPKAKIIERVIGTSQNMMEHLPGYVGRDEKNVRYERVQKFLQSLKKVNEPRKADIDPREMLLSKERFADELVKVMRDFADEPQNGERLRGLSPAEAWTQHALKKPHIVLPDSLRYLLSTHRSQQTVTGEGVKLRIGSNFQYYVGSERLGALQGEKVHVYYNEELPGQIVVIHPASDPKGLNPFSVPMFKRVPAATATAADFANAKAHQRAFASYGKETYRMIAPPTNTTLRDQNFGSSELRERGEKINGLEREHVELAGKRTRHAGTILKLAKRSGLAIDPGKVRNPERVVESLSRAQQLEEEIKQMESDGMAGAQESHGHSVKTYTLKPAPAKGTSIAQRFTIFKNLWERVEAAKPGLNQYAIMQRATGKNSLKKMTDQEFSKLCEVVNAIARDNSL